MSMRRRMQIRVETRTEMRIETMVMMKMMQNMMMVKKTKKKRKCCEGGPVQIVVVPHSKGLPAVPCRPRGQKRRGKRAD